MKRIFFLAIALSACSSSPSIEKSSATESYENTEYGVLRILKINRNAIDGSKILFDFSAESSSGKSINLRGTAIKQEGDPEILEDEGGSYPADSYLYKDECWLIFQIEMGDGLRAKIVESDCKSLEGFSSDGNPKKLLLRKR